MKAKGRDRERNLHVRLSQPEETAFSEAARINGLTLSGWVRQISRREAITALREAGKAKLVEALTR